eukprot:752166-Hanusia_phi.AAC.2
MGYQDSGWILPARRQWRCNHSRALRDLDRKVGWYADGWYADGCQSLVIECLHTKTTLSDENGKHDKAHCSVGKNPECCWLGREGLL